MTCQWNTRKETCAHCGLCIEYQPFDGTYRDLRYRANCPGQEINHEPVSRVRGGWPLTKKQGEDINEFLADRAQ